MKSLVNHKDIISKLKSIDVEVNDTKQFNLIVVQTPFGVNRIKTTLSLDEWMKLNNIKNGKKKGNSKSNNGKKHR